ncbi:mRNA surveillance protein Pelota [Sulfolobus acidocaldarius SUSAZ]|nr:mRNA surveillance protein Pelota [Sulfolobus acidocaldarius SUSAZ]
MKILEFNDKRGSLKLHVENEDDLWLLHIIIKKGDRIVAKTTRDISMGKDSRRIPMTIELQVEYTEFQNFTTRLRIHGLILDAPERFGIKGAHHTVNLDIGDEVIIIKEQWNNYELEKIREQEEKKGKLLIALVDVDEYIIALLMKQGVKVLAEKSLQTPGKDNDVVNENIEEMANEIISFVKLTGVNVIIIAGPGPFKDMVNQKIKQIDNKLIVYVDSVSSASRAGLNELLRRDIIDQVYREFEIAQQLKILESIMENLAKNTGLVMYGIEDIKKANELGAVDKLLITEDYLTDTGREIIDELLRDIEKKKGKIMIVPKDSPIYYQVKNLTGIVSLLRFRIN